MLFPHPWTREHRFRLALVLLLTIGISLLHLALSRDMEKVHVIARELYFLPIILGAIWFGLRGALLLALAISSFYLAYSLMHWRGFSADDLDRLLEILFFLLVAGITGYLQDRQKRLAAEKLEAIRALAGTVAHEINSPLFVAMGTLELLQDDFEPGSEPYREIESSRKNLEEVKTLVKKISVIEEVVIRDYDGTSRIIDLDESSPKDGAHHR